MTAGRLVSEAVGNAAPGATTGTFAVVLAGAPFPSTCAHLTPPATKLMPWTKVITYETHAAQSVAAHARLVALGPAPDGAFSAFHSPFPGK